MCRRGAVCLGIENRIENKVLMGCRRFEKKKKNRTVVADGVGVCQFVVGVRFRLNGSDFVRGSVVVCRSVTRCFCGLVRIVRV